MKKLFAILAVMGVMTLGSIQPMMAQEEAAAAETAVVEEGGIPEENAVDKKDRIASRTDFFLGPAGVQMLFFAFKDAFGGGGADDKKQRDQIGNGDHAAQQADRPNLDAQLGGCQIDAKDAIPKYYKIHTDAQKHVPKIRFPIMGQEQEGQKNLRRSAEKYGNVKCRQQHCAVLADEETLVMQSGDP
jgi:hypothetical protein